MTGEKVGMLNPRASSPVREIKKEVARRGTQTRRNEEDMPEGWVRTTFLDVLDYEGGAQPPKICTLSEQHEVVRRVEALFKLADAIEKRVAAATARADKLAQSILAKAFRGELVPTEAELARAEGREYEPASVLLERIRKEKEEGAKMKRGRRAKAVQVR